MVKGRMWWIPPEMIEEVTRIMEENKLQGRCARAEAMKAIVEHARVGREMDKLMKRMNVWRL